MKYIEIFRNILFLYYVFPLYFYRISIAYPFCVFLSSVVCLLSSIPYKPRIVSHPENLRDTLRGNFHTDIPLQTPYRKPSKKSPTDIFTEISSWKFSDTLGVIITQISHCKPRIVNHRKNLQQTFSRYSRGNNNTDISVLLLERATRFGLVTLTLAT